MKKQLVLLIATAILFLFFQSFRPEPPSDAAFPDEITSIIEFSCYDCHFTGGGSEKSLNAVNFDEWDGYRLTKQIGLLGKIGEVLEEDKMPPAKYLENKPDRKLSEEQKKKLSEWTRQEADKLMQGN